MAFWGVYLKPNEPYTLHCDDVVQKRLRITQATLGDATRNSPARSIVRCSVGDKPATAICSLSIRELTCCQLELEFEESHDVIFSVFGPRGVYLAGYLITPALTAHQHTIDHNGREKATTEIGGCNDQGLHKDEHEFSKRVKESTRAQNRDIEHCDKNIKGGKCLLKCLRDKNREEKIITTLGQKMGKDGNEDTSFGTEKYVNRRLSSCDEDRGKTIAVKTHSVFGRLLEEKRDAIERRRKKKKRNRKRKLSTSEATTSEYEKFGSDSRITEENGDFMSKYDAHERNDCKAKERKKKHKRKHTLDCDQHQSMEHIDGGASVPIIRNSNDFENRRDNSSGKVKSREQDRKISKIVLTKKIVG